MTQILTIRLTTHSESRMKERGITMVHIKKAFAFPDSTLKQSDGKIRIYKKYGRKTLRLVYMPSMYTKEKGVIVVTVLWE
jgi:hypothetical protein